MNFFALTFLDLNSHYNDAIISFPSDKNNSNAANNISTRKKKEIYASEAD